MRQTPLATHADLARRLEQIELLFDLHSASMPFKAVTVIAQRLVRVRRQLQERARREEFVRGKLEALRKNLELGQAAAVEHDRGVGGHDRLA